MRALKNILRCLLLAAAASGWLCAAAAQPEPAAQPYRTRNVLIMVLDGVRADEAWGDAERRNIPRLAELARQGVVYTNFRNSGETNTNPGHATLVTGFLEQIDNYGEQRPAHPTIFQLWRKASGQPASAAWVIASKDKLEVLADSADAQWRGVFRPSADCGLGGGGAMAGYRDDPDTYAVLIKVLARDHPRLVLVNFKDTDSAGHSGSFSAYVQAIRKLDQYAADLWKWLQQDAGYAGATALFVTTDHGRHSEGVLDGFVNHGCSCEGCRRLFLVALGPDFRRGVIVDEPRDMVDLAVTIGKLLAFEVPGSPGKVLHGLFPPRPVPAKTPARVEKQTEPVLEPAGR